MRAARSNADERVVYLNCAAGNDFRFFHHADTEAGQVVILLGIQAWHFGGLTTDERTAGLPTALTDAFNDACGDDIVEAATRVVIEKE
jgi:hypothetical protein